MHFYTIQTHTFTREKNGIRILEADRSVAAGRPFHVAEALKQQYS